MARRSPVETSGRLSRLTIKINISTQILRSLRPGAILTVEDELIYNFLVGRLLREIVNNLNPLQGDPDIAYQLKKNPEHIEWTTAGVEVWTSWRKLSKSKLRDSSYLAVADIAGYYENINPRFISSDLKEISDQSAVINSLSELLQKWAQPRGRGLPQGHSASDILAKVYLYPIDLALQNRGVKHLRYVDDASQSGLVLPQPLTAKKGACVHVLAGGRAGTARSGRLFDLTDRGYMTHASGGETFLAVLIVD